MSLREALPLNLDHEPADFDEAKEMLRRAKAALSSSTPEPVPTMGGMGVSVCGCSWRETYGVPGSRVEYFCEAHRPTGQPSTPEPVKIIRDEHDCAAAFMPSMSMFASKADYEASIPSTPAPAVTEAWNRVREEARALASGRGIGNLLQAVEEYANATVGQASKEKP